MDENFAIEALGALAQPTRLRVFRALVKAKPGGIAAGDISEREGVPHNTMSAHLAILVRAGLVQSRRDGRSVFYSASLEGTRALLAFLVSDCCNGHPEICAPLIEVAERSCCSPPRAKSATRAASQKRGRFTKPSGTTRRRA